MVKNTSADTGDVRDLGSVPGLGRCPAGGPSNSLQYSCLENPMDRGSWQASSLGLKESETTEPASVPTHDIWCFLFFKCIFP